MIISDGKVLTKEDFIKISRLSPNIKEIAVGTGNGNFSFSSFQIKEKYQIDDKLPFFRTKKGYQIVLTYDQPLFCRLNWKEKVFYVFLVKTEAGYFITVAEPTFFLNSSKGKVVRIIEKMWILSAFTSIEQAIIEANLLSVKYGVPYSSLAYKNNESFSLTVLDYIFKSVDISARVQIIFEELKIEEDKPHFSFKRKDKVLNLVLFGDSEGKHSLYLENSRDILTRKRKKYDNLNLKQLAATISDYLELQTFAETLFYLDEVELVYKYKISRTSEFYLYPASNVFIGMEIPIFDGEKIVEDVITEKKTIDYKGEVARIEVPQYYNYLYNGIIIPAFK